ncbi:TFIIH basal transcription factor complex p44 subunit [Perkinsela sp. CCAP 1560/4]|nr:TFIIH basal transcription factor complex p44 subunit [Perkinsela sp. CCAP 1560/4]|eukprot:KNH09654.1 TFIIH basal transcription factor complex p44 subunit [Perkinsela sp. CCAP 1560/4]
MPPGDGRSLPCLMRRFVLIIDHSEHALKQTYFQNYIEYVRFHVPRMVRQAHWYHTLSSFALVLTQDATASVQCPLVCSPDDFEEAFSSAFAATASGEQSVGLSLRKAMELLTHGSQPGLRNEILYFTASLLTLETFNVMSVIQRISEEKIHCNVINFCCHIHVFSALAKAGHGGHYVPLDEAHLQLILLEILHAHITEPFSNTTSELISLGFPIIRRINQNDINSVRFCVCHLYVPEYTYECPRCCACLCDMPPKQCPICGFLIIPSAAVHRRQVETQQIISSVRGVPNEKATAPSMDTREFPIAKGDPIGRTIHDEICSICDFPFTQESGGHGGFPAEESDLPEQNAYVCCKACGARQCMICVQYIQDFLYESPCCGALLK